MRKYLRTVTTAISMLALTAIGLVASTNTAMAHEIVIQPGETLSEIAQENDTTVAEISKLNNIDSQDEVKAGDRILLPAGHKVADTQKSEPQAVKLVDTSQYPRLPANLLAKPERLQLIPIFEDAAAEFDVPADLLMAVTYRESGWQTDVVSVDDAIGVGQLLPSTAKWLDTYYFPRGSNLDPFVAKDNIRMSARYLKWLENFMQNNRSVNGAADALSNQDRTLAGYYQGPGSVNSRAGGLYIDTKEYVAGVQGTRALFRKTN